MILFFVSFEAVLNGFAELSRFGDREFYEVRAVSQQL
jgi:hypothetical protein